MPRTITACLTFGLLAVTLIACSSSAPSIETKPTPAGTTDSINARCRAQNWPQPMPNLAGKTFDSMSSGLVCFDRLKALAPDGHDVMADAANAAGEWVIVSSKPSPGASVRISTPITLKLRAPKAVR
ncbi:hypothetical protein [Streptomyces sp. NPDC048508]|uniref:PASTA domain-containing protein n=1 Tax=Streptomyces sp. NPDC048508 TaxID=3365561 RepID=UPI00371F26F5